MTAIDALNEQLDAAYGPLQKASGRRARGFYAKREDRYLGLHARLAQECGVELVGPASSVPAPAATASTLPDQPRIHIVTLAKVFGFAVAFLALFALMATPAWASRNVYVEVAAALAIIFGGCTGLFVGLGVIR